MGMTRLYLEEIEAMGSTMRVKDIVADDTELIMEKVMDRVLLDCAALLEEMADTIKAHEMTGREALLLAAEAFREKAKLQ